MNKDHLLNLTLTLLMATTTTLVFILMKPKARLEQAIAVPKVADDGPVVKLKSAFYNLYPTLVIPSDHKLVSAKTLVKTPEGQSRSLKELVGNKPRLILRYSHIDCEVCVDSVVSQIHRITKREKLPELLILTDIYTERDFLIKTRNKKYAFATYGLPGTNLGLPLENKNLPFLFVLTPDFKATKIFVPFKEVPYQTTEYLKEIFRYLNVRVYE